MTFSHFQGGVRSLLRESLVQSLAPEKGEPRPELAAQGPKARVQCKHPRSVHPDEVVLEVRRLHEVEGLGPVKIIAMFPSMYGIELNNSVNGWLKYENRSLLVPTPGRREPYLPLKKS